MAFMNVRSDDLLDDGPYEAELRDVEKKENANGTYLHWKFRIPGTNAEVDAEDGNAASFGRLLASAVTRIVRHAGRGFGGPRGRNGLGKGAKGVSMR